MRFYSDLSRVHVHYTVHIFYIYYIYIFSKKAKLIESKGIIGVININLIIYGQL